MARRVDEPACMTTATRSAAKRRGAAKISATTTPNGLPRERHVTFETAALAGAASGVVVGAIGGPPGAIVGGLIGTAIGMMAGSTLDDAQRRADAHQRELDDAIGVTEGDLGARESAVEGLKKVTEGGAMWVDRERTTASELLRAEHAHLENTYEKLLAAYDAGDWNDVAASWNTFEVELRAHMAREERHVFPSFIATSPVEAKQLLAEHDELRGMLDTLGVNIELHAVSSTVAAELVRRLRAHGEHEEQIFYPWIDATFGHAPLHEISPSAR